MLWHFYIPDAALKNPPPPGRTWRTGAGCPKGADTADKKATKSNKKQFLSWGTWSVSNAFSHSHCQCCRKWFFSYNSQRLGRFSGYHRWIERKKVGRVLIIFQSSKTLKHMPKVKLFFSPQDSGRRCKQNNLLYFTFWQTLMPNPEQGSWLENMI